MNKTGQCKLCKQERVLQKSHVIPKFVRRGTKPSGAVEDPKYYMAEGGKFLNIEQDLPKKTWLCQECEQLLSRSEKRFAEAVYHGIWKGRKVSDSSHAEHVHRFLVSMAWRTWHWHDEHKEKPFSKISNKDRLREAEEVWRRYLLGKRSDVGEFKQHMLVQNGQMVDSTGRAVELNSFYWNRGVGLDLLEDGGSKEAILMVYAKIPKIAMFGVVEEEVNQYWCGTLVDPSQGNIWSNQKASVPAALTEYIEIQGDKLLGALDGVPEVVKDKTRRRMETLIEQEGDGYLKRDAVQSLVEDDMMELPQDSIISDVLRRLANNSDARAQKIYKLFCRLTEAEMRSLHQETNRCGIRCKTLNVEERFSFLADGREEESEPGKAILVGVEVFSTQERATQRSQLPLNFRLESEQVTVAIGVEIVPVPKGYTDRGVIYLA